MPKICLSCLKSFMSNDLDSSTYFSTYAHIFMGHPTYDDYIVISISFQSPPWYKFQPISMSPHWSMFPSILVSPILAKVFFITKTEYTPLVKMTFHTQLKSLYLEVITYFHMGYITYLSYTPHPHCCVDSDEECMV